MSQFAKGFGLAVAVLLVTCLISLGSYEVGALHREQKIVYDCNEFGRYKFDGAQELLCTAIINPLDLMPDLSKPPFDPKARKKKEKK